MRGSPAAEQVQHTTSAACKISRSAARLSELNYSKWDATNHYQQLYAAAALANGRGSCPDALTFFSSACESSPNSSFSIWSLCNSARSGVSRWRTCWCDEAKRQQTKTHTATQRTQCRGRGRKEESRARNETQGTHTEAPLPRRLKNSSPPTAEMARLVVEGQVLHMRINHLARFRTETDDAQSRLVDLLSQLVNRYVGRGADERLALVLLGEVIDNGRGGDSLASPWRPLHDR
jgi:hypothetical protein